MYRGVPQSTLWVEGISPSSSLDDIGLRLSFDSYGPAIDESTLKFQLNGVTIPTSRLTIERTTDTIGPYPILAAMTITYNHPLPGELIIPGKNTVKVDIDDMVRNHMNQIVQDFNVPSSY